MNPSPIDPHNHAPAVTADDVWGDAVGGSPTTRGSTTDLPRKKAKVEPPSSPSLDRNLKGLRIESKTPPRSPDVSSHQIEVREIDGNVVRLDPEVPSAPRIPRQSTPQECPVENAAQRSPRGESAEWGLPRQQSIRWILSASLGIAAVVIVALMLLPLINESNAARPDQAQAAYTLDQEEDKAGQESWKALASRQQEAEQVFRAFASAVVVDDMLLLVRDSGSVTSLIRANRRPALVSKAWVPPANTLWNVMENDGFLCGFLEGYLPDDSRFGAYLVMSGKQLLLDWKATTVYATATFDELEIKQGNPAEIRARIIASDFFTSTFPEEDYQCYKLLSPDNRTAIWGYARRNEVAHNTLSKLLQTVEILENTQVPPQKVTLRLDPGPAGALPNQWLIQAILHKDWITPSTQTGL
jgi:hypothetical protein